MMVHLKTELILRITTIKKEEHIQIKTQIAKGKYSPVRENNPQAKAKMNKIENDVHVYV